MIQSIEGKATCIFEPDVFFRRLVSVVHIFMIDSGLSYLLGFRDIDKLVEYREPVERFNLWKRGKVP